MHLYISRREIKMFDVAEDQDEKVLRPRGLEARRRQDRNASAKNKRWIRKALIKAKSTKSFSDFKDHFIKEKLILKPLTNAERQKRHREKVKSIIRRNFYNFEKMMLADEIKLTSDEFRQFINHIPPEMLKPGEKKYPSWLKKEAKEMQKIMDEHNKNKGDENGKEDD